MYKTEYQCRECGTACVESFDVQWLQCPICSPICHDKPPDFCPAGEWDFPDAGPVEMAQISSMTEQAWDY